MEWVVNATPRRLPPGKDPVPIVHEAGWAPGPVWTGAVNLAPKGIRSPDCPARRQRLYIDCATPANTLLLHGSNAAQAVRAEDDPRRC